MAGLASMLREVLTNPWWSFDSQTTGGWGVAYRWFNLCEGAIWAVFAALVIRRWHAHRRSRLEIVYAAVFLLFGLTDFREAYVQSAALVGTKAIVLVSLFSIRRRVLKTCYPHSRLY